MNIALAVGSLLAGCASSPPRLETSALQSSVSAKVTGTEALDPEQHARTCQHLLTEIDTRRTELAKLQETHRAELAKPPATLFQVWGRATGSDDTAAAKNIRQEQAKIGGLDAQLDEHHCPKLNMAAATPKATE